MSNELITKENPVFDTATFDHMWRVAKGMAQSPLMPQHLRGKTDNENTANFMMVVNQARRWGMDPYAVAGCTYVIKGKLGFEGKLVAAVVNELAGLTGRLSYKHVGEGADLKVIVSGTFADTGETETVEVTLQQAAKSTCEMWKTDPHQKLCYTGATKWARRHCPEVMLGVQTDDDVYAIQASQNTVAQAGSIENLLNQGCVEDPFDGSQGEGAGRSTPVGTTSTVGGEPEWTEQQQAAMEGQTPDFCRGFTDAHEGKRKLNNPPFRVDDRMKEWSRGFRLACSMVEENPAIENYRSIIGLAALTELDDILNDADADEAISKDDYDVIDQIVKDRIAALEATQ